MADTKISALDTTNTNALRAKVLSQRGARATLSADLAFSGLTFPWLFTGTAEDYDTDSVHDTATNNHRLVVPAGITLVRLGFVIRVNWASGGTSTDYVSAIVRKNQTDTALTPSRGCPVASGTKGAFSDLLIGDTGDKVSVTGGDWFDLRIATSWTGAPSFKSDTCAFWMEILA